MPSPPQPSATSPLFSLPPFESTSIPRLQALYSDFSRQKHSNPTSYHANVEWWRKALESIVSSGSQRGHEDIRLSLHAKPSLLEGVKIPKVGKPLALGAVVSELRSSRTLIPLPEFLSPSRVSIYDPGWLPGRIAAYVVGKPLWWALEQLGVVGEEGILGSGNRHHHHADTSWQATYVFVSLVEKAAEAVLERHAERMASPGDALYTRADFRKVFAGVTGNVEGAALDDADTKVLLQYLAVDRRAVVVDGGIIKFVDPDASPDERALTAVDRGIVELKAAVQNLHTQIESLQHKMDGCTTKASAALQQKQKSIALSYLRSRKQLEDLLHKRLGSLSTLESTLITVEAAAGDVEIMKSYQSSTATLKAILSHPSLQRDSIDETLEALADANADAKEVSSAVSIGGDIALGVGDGIDDDELEKELQAMVREAEKESEDHAREREVGNIKSKLEGVEVPKTIPADERQQVEESLQKETEALT